MHPYVTKDLIIKKTLSLHQLPQALICHVIQFLKAKETGRLLMSCNTLYNTPVLYNLLSTSIKNNRPYDYHDLDLYASRKNVESITKHESRTIQHQLRLSLQSLSGNLFIASSTNTPLPHDEQYLIIRLYHLYQSSPSPIRGGHTPLFKRFITSIQNYLFYQQDTVDLFKQLQSKNSDSRTEQIIAKITTTPLLIFSKGPDNSTPLHWIAWNGPTGVLEWLLHRGADITAKSNHGCTTLHWAAWHDSPSKDIIQILLRARANVTIKTKFQHTPLQLADSKGDKEITNLLRNAGAIELA